jgi:DNA-binding transcriptional LysR family regulator
MLNLEWLRTFKVIYEVGTLTAAAQSLFISQPGVSLHLNSLEAYTGYRLFERDNRRCIPTDRATILYNNVIDSLMRLEDIERIFHQKSKTGNATVSVGMCYEIFEHTLGDRIGKLPFNLIARYGDCAQLIEDLNNGAIDFILTSQNTPLANIVYTPFQKQRIVLVCGQDIDITEFETFLETENLEGARGWLKKQAWFATSADMEYLKSFWSNNFGVLPDFQPNYILPSFNSILRSLNGGNGFAVMPDFLCKDQIEKKQIKLVWEGNSPLEHMLHFGKRKKTIYSKELQQLEELVAGNWFA